MRRILLIGRNGQLGRELNRSLIASGELTAVDYPDIDLAKPETIRTLVQAVRPGVIVNAAAYTAVDLAETEQEKAWAINAEAPGVMAEEARRMNAVFVHYSTDYVFDGQKTTPYDENDSPAPLNQYGLSKLEGERRVQAAGGTSLVFRTSWVYSLRMSTGFVAKTLQWARQQEKIRVVSDQVSNPTWARLLAEASCQVLRLDPEHLQAQSGLYHVASRDFTSRFDWARQILELDPDRQDQLVKEVLPTSSSEFPTPARRPAFSALNCERFQKAFNLYLPGWRETLALAMDR
jgi:dTDP-4-dehydrorhamnose reductase